MNIFSIGKSLLFGTGIFFVIGSAATAGEDQVTADTSPVWLVDLLMEPGRTIAVGGSGSVLTLADGDGGEHQVHGGERHHWNAIAYGDGAYVIVGARGKILRSLDGTNWGPLDTGEPGNLNAVHFGLGQFFAADEGDFGTTGGGAALWSSTNGEVWEKTTIVDAGRIRAIASGGDRIVAAGMRAATSDGVQRAGIWSSDDGTTWTPRLEGANGLLRDVTYGGGQFVAVGGGGLIYSSYDGIDWQRAGIPSTDPLQTVAYGNGGFLVTGGIGDRQVTFTSTDGLVWEAGTPPPGHGLFGLVFDGDRFVGVGAYETMATTVDGSTWAVETRGGQPSLWGIAENSGQLMAVGESGEVLESDDGEIWHPNPGGTGRWWWDVAAGGGEVVSVGRFGAIQRRADDEWHAVRPRPSLADFLQFHALGDSAAAVDRDRRLWLSTNGMDWAPAGSPFEQRPREFFAANQLLVATGPGDALAFSDNGFDWTERVWAKSSILSDLIFADGAWWAVTRRGGIFLSPDLAVWTEAYANSDDPLHAIAYHEDVFYAAGSKQVSGESFHYMLISPDGQSWTKHALDGEVAGLTGFQEHLVATRGGSVIKSDDGLLWQAVMDLDSGALISVHHDGNRIVAESGGVLYRSFDAVEWHPFDVPTTLSIHAFGSFDSHTYVAGRRGLILRSQDEADWEPVSSGEEMRALAYGAGIFVTVGENGIANVSDDGVSWSWRDTGASYLRPTGDSGEFVEERAHLWSVAYGDGLFVAVGQNGTIVYSENGEDWVQADTGVAGALRSVAFGDGRFVAAGEGGLLLFSNDGLNWASAESPLLTEWGAIAFSEGQWVAFGQAGDAATSADAISWVSTTVETESVLNAATTFGDAWIAVGTGGEVVAFSGEPKPSIGYNAWRDRLFGWTERQEPSISGPEGDPDGIGISNFLRYAFGFESRGWESGLLPVLDIWRMDENGVEADFLVLSFVRRRDLPDFDYVIEGSANLMDWAEVEAVEVHVEQIDASRETVTYREPDRLPENSGRRFLRVRLEE